MFSLFLFLQCWLARSRAAFLEFEDESAEPVDGFGKMASTVRKAREMTVNSRFHTFVGKKQEPDKFRLNYLCSYSDSTYIYGLEPKLGSGETVLAYLDGSMHDSSVDNQVKSYHFISMEIRPEALIKAYATTLGILSSGSDPGVNTGLLGIIFENNSSTKPLTFNFVFTEDLAPKLLLEFYKMYDPFVKDALPPHSKDIIFDKNPERNLNFEWELRVASLPEPLLVFRNTSVLCFLVDLIPPMFLHDLALVRADAANLVKSGYLPSVSLSMCSTQVAEITLETLKDIEMKDLSIFECRLNRGIDAVVAIEFSNLFKEFSGASKMRIYFKCDPGRGSAVPQVSRAVTELDGMLQFAEKYYCPDFRNVVSRKPIIFEHWFEKTLQAAYQIKSLDNLFMLKDQAWAKEQLKPGSFISIRHPVSAEDHSPFTRIGYAEFFKCDLPIVLNRIYYLLFVNNAAPWVDLVDYVLLRPTKDSEKFQVTGPAAFEIIVAFFPGPQIEAINIQKMMADLFCGIIAARAFANGLIRNADGKVPLLQYSHEDYHHEQLIAIQRRILEIELVKDQRHIKTGEPAEEFKEFHVYSNLHSTANFHHMGLVETLFDDVFMDTIDLGRPIGRFSILGKERKIIYCDIYECKVSKAAVLPTLRNIVRICKSINESGGEDNILDLIAVELMGDSAEDAGMSVVVGFTVDSTETHRNEILSQFGLGENVIGNRGYTGFVMEPIGEPESLGSPWTLTFKHGEEIIVKDFNDLSILQNYMSWLKPSLLMTVTSSAATTAQPTSVLKLDLRDCFVSSLLFDMDVWNMMENKKRMDIWHAITKIQFNPIENHPMYELSAQFHLKPTTDALAFAGLMNNRLMRLVLVDTFRLFPSPSINGHLLVSGYKKPILSTKEFLESIKEWPKSIGRKDTLSFQRAVVGTPVAVRMQALRLVVKAEKLAQLFAVAVDILMGGFDGTIATDSFQFLIRQIKRKADGGSKRKQKMQANAECIWVFTRSFQDDDELIAYSKIFSGTIGIYGVAPIDLSVGWFSLQGQNFSPIKKLDFDLNLFLEVFDAKAAILQSAANPNPKQNTSDSSKQESSKKKRKVTYTKAEEPAKPSAAPMSTPVESSEADPQILPAIASVLAHERSETTSSVKRPLAEVSVQADKTDNPNKPAVTLAASITARVGLSRRRIPINTLF